MSLFSKGARLYELPEPLRKYLQDKAASGIPYLSIIPLAFPVFVMNPSEYSPRLNWYDRNPSNVIKSYFGWNIAPHTLTERWTYTVPNGRKCLIESLEIAAIRLTQSAAPVGFIDGKVIITDGAVSGVMTSVSLLDNTIGAKSQSNLGHGMLAFAGNVINAHTQDASTSGTVIYRIALKGTEFDA